MITYSVIVFAIIVLASLVVALRFKEPRAYALVVSLDPPRPAFVRDVVGRSLVPCSCTTGGGWRFSARKGVQAVNPVAQLRAGQERQLAHLTAEQTFNGTTSPAVIQGTPEWRVDNGGAVALEPQNDGRDCDLVGVAEGSFTVTVTATVDTNTGPQPLTTTFTGTVTAVQTGPTFALKVTLDAPRPIV